ncbi:complex I subunit 1/NuoH family protein [Natrialba asiatica]|uniref:NADH dehydrogenase (Quinone) n=1 Tax=Natrialba asiatica (strain ATCC 700177 / DSM 12278 / JCM 9576 / FERM P-10747 / NBRC 102637 / 172P1) TaxID=29540 RepID=M0APD9_NATA1|nr:complex I subunit 1 family protein [Natrialba asiatica]ELZ00400.1 NADH dehydrogenase (quinone) [Natrialba asiatica DSM 12278]
MNAATTTPIQSDVLLPERLGDLTGLNEFGLAGELLSTLIGAVIVGSLILTMTAVAGPWAKRKITASFTDRISINQIGPAGIGIIIADAVRMLSKENIIPENADRPAYDLAPIVIVGSALLGFAVIPMGSGIQLADPEVGLAFAFAVAGIASIGLVMAGYASGNKYSLLGGLRAVAQNVAYEIPLVVTGMSVVLFAGSLQMGAIVDAQNTQTLVDLGVVSIPAWYALVNPFAFVLFLIANFAEVGRNPFDMPEAPAELVAGYQTEYSSVYFVLVYLGEFLHIFLGGAIISTIFLGGPAGPGPAALGIVWFTLKIWGVFFLTQWLRSAVPRVRIDQLIEIGWKGLLVLSFANLGLTAAIVGVIA